MEISILFSSGRDAINRVSTIYKENDITVDAPYMLKLNFWSREHWIGGPPEENVECVYQIDWIRFTPMHLLPKD